MRILLIAILLVELSAGCARLGELTDHVIVVADSQSDRIELRLIFGYDAAQTRPGAGWMMARVLEGANSSAFEQNLNELSALGVSIHATAERECILLDANIPSAASESALDLLAQRLTIPISDGLAVDQLKQLQSAALDSLRGDSDWLARSAFWAAVYDGTVYAIPEAGVNSTIESLSTADLESFRTKFITKGNYLLGVSGSVTQGEVADFNGMLRELLPQGERIVPQLPAKTIRGLNVRIVQLPTVNEATVLIATHPVTGVSDTASLVLAMAAALHATEGGSLTGMDQSLRAERGLTEGVDITTTLITASTVRMQWREDGLSHSSRFAVNLQTSTINALYAISIVLKELSDISTTGIAQDDIARMTTLLASSANSNAGGQMRSQVAKAWQGIDSEVNVLVIIPDGLTPARGRKILRDHVDPADLWVIAVVPDGDKFCDELRSGMITYLYPEWVDRSLIRRLDQEYLSYRPFWETERMVVHYADSLFR